MASVNGSTSPAAEEDQLTPVSPSAAKVADSNDLLTSILSRLPVKPLITFKSVSKRWLSLISDPNFSLYHTLRNPTPKTSGIFFHPKSFTTEYDFVSLSNTTPSPPFKSLDFVDDPLGILIEKSCNGLLLCCNRCPGLKNRTRNYFIYNPTTKQFSILPPPGGGDDGAAFSSYYTDINLAYDPSKSPHYKIVLFKNVEGSNRYFHTQIYSSETRSWRRCGDDFEWSEFSSCSKGVYWNNSIHWVTTREGWICFDLDREYHKQVPRLPQLTVSEDTSVTRYLGESGGHLLLVDIQVFRVMEIDVYGLERDYSQWSLMYRVDLNQLVASCPDLNLVSPGYPTISLFCNFAIINLVRVKEENEASMILHVPGKVVSYNFKQRSIEQFRDALSGEIHRPCRPSVNFYGYQFFETLACV